MIRLPSSTGGSRTINEVAGGGPLPWLPGIPDRIAADPNWGPYLRRPITAGCSSSPTRSASTPELKRRPGRPSARSRVGRADRRHTGVARRHPGRPQRPATHRATPARPRRPNLPTATRQATRRRGHPTRWRWRQLLATEVPSATADPFLPELAERLSNLTRAGFDATLPRAVGGRRRTPTRRPPRRSPLVAHPRSATANAEPGPRNPQRRPSDQAHDHDVTDQRHPCRARRRLRRSARAAENVAASQRRRSVSQSLLPNSSTDQGRLLRGGDWQCPVRRLRHFGERRLGKEVRTTLGDVSDLRKHDVPPRGTPEGYEGGDASSSPLTTGTCPRSLWRRNDTRRTPRTTTGNPPGGTP